MSTIYIYAELLLNVRSVTVFILLPTICRQDTQIAILPNCSTLHVQYDGKSAMICLPCVVADNANIGVPDSKCNEITFRLQPSPHASLSVCNSQNVMSHSLWSSTTLPASTQISCRSCKNALTKPIAIWKDLPSTGWADMMDLWHCHKPNPLEDTHGGVENTKGYAASNMLGPEEGVGLVGITDFCLSEYDCIGVRVSQSQQPFLTKSKNSVAFPWASRRWPAPK